MPPHALPTCARVRSSGRKEVAKRAQIALEHEVRLHRPLDRLDHFPVAAWISSRSRRQIACCSSGSASMYSSNAGQSHSSDATDSPTGPAPRARIRRGRSRGRAQAHTRTSTSSRAPYEARADSDGSGPATPRPVDRTSSRSTENLTPVISPSPPGSSRSLSPVRRCRVDTSSRRMQDTATNALTPLSYRGGRARQSAQNRPSPLCRSAIPATRMEH